MVQKWIKPRATHHHCRDALYLVAFIAFAPEEIPLIKGKFQGREGKFH